jgi:uncharacterized protein (TIGR03083 family)
MTIADFYRDGRMRMLALAAELTEPEASRPTPACPGWTVTDVFAHQAGVAVDILAGRLEGVGTDPWTARQVAARADRTLPEIAEELADAGAKLDRLVRAVGDRFDARLVIDQWTHEQDIRGALDRQGARDAPVVPVALAVLLGNLGDRWTDRGLMSIRVVGSTREWVLGAGEPAATWRGDDFELLRLLAGRRSRRQALARWVGAGEPVADELVMFSFAQTDILE